MTSYIPTGNEAVSLPTIRERDGGIETVSFLYMAQKGLVELRGNASEPLILPFVQELDPDHAAEGLAFSDLHWTRSGYWIPEMTAEANGVRLTVSYLSPIAERGFGLRLTVKSEQAKTLRFGLKGHWAGAWHCVNEEKKLEGTLHCYESGWNDSLIFDMRCGFPLFAFAPMADQEVRSSYVCKDDGVSYALSLDCELKANVSETLTVWWGVGFEEVAAATSAKEMLRRGWDWEYAKTATWLQARTHEMPTPKLTEIYNTNLFFCIFYATGITLDTEELICATSRSSRYYVSAAYWDRDTLLWSFPAILDADPKLARQILGYIFGRQRRNLGVHSRYIDGTVLEPGFELDELAAPIIALVSYVEKTGDRAILTDSMQDAIAEILEKLTAVRHPSVELYETFLQPTDDERVYPYITYDNMLVWLVLSSLSRLCPEKYAACAEQAANVKQAIYEHCVFLDAEGKPYFGWSVDLNGHHDVYDEPPGSQQLYPYYGFCSAEDEIWQNTVRMIRSPDYAYSFAGQPIAEIGCPHAPYPWVLSICNSLLCGHAVQAWRELEQIRMDNGIACESVDPVNGVCMTGAAFATCAGFLCHSMRVAAKGDKP